MNNIFLDEKVEEKKIDCQELRYIYLTSGNSQESDKKNGVFLQILDFYYWRILDSSNILKGFLKKLSVIYVLKINVLGILIIFF